MIRARVTAVLAITAIALTGSVLTASAATRHVQAWHLVRAPEPAPNAVLNAIAVVSKKAAWAGGLQGFTSNGSVPGRPLLERWNGRTWSISSLPITWKGGIAALSAASASNAWVLGQDDSGLAEHVLHWGGNRWRTAPDPLPTGTIVGDLRLTSAPGGPTWLSANMGALSAKIYSWRGAGWQQQSYSCPGMACSLYGLTARTATDAWAVGNYLSDSTHGSSLALHWNGHQWLVTHVPYVEHGYLTGVFGVSKGNAWAVGFVFNSTKALLYHWTGGAWHSVPTPASLSAPFLGENTGITGDASGRLWIYDYGLETAGQAHYLRYNGHQWSVAYGPVSATQTSVLVRSVAVVPGTSNAWSVGLGMVHGNQARARIEYYS